jgi:hypothetical protein
MLREEVGRIELDLGWAQGKLFPSHKDRKISSGLVDRVCY